MRIRHYKPIAALAAILTVVVAIAGAAHAQPLTKIRYTLDWRYEGHFAMFMMAKGWGWSSDGTIWQWRQQTTFSSMKNARIRNAR